jgi:hypothetical protein
VKNKVRVNKYEINNTHKPRPWLSVLVNEIFSPVAMGRGRGEGEGAEIQTHEPWPRGREHYRYQSRIGTVDRSALPPGHRSFR